MDNLSLPFKWLVLNNGQLEFTLSSLFQVVSPKQWTTWVYLLSWFKWVVLNNGQLEFTFCLCFKWLVLNNGQLEFTFRLCFKCLVLENEQLEFTFQVDSPKQWTAWVYLLSFFEWSIPNNGQLVFTCHPLKCHPQYVWSRGVSIKLSFQANTIVHHHFHQWNYIIP